MIKNLSYPCVFLSSGKSYIICDCGELHYFFENDDDIDLCVIIDNSKKIYPSIRKYQCNKDEHQVNKYILLDKYDNVKTNEYINWLQKNGLPTDDFMNIIGNDERVYIRDVTRLSDPTYIFDPSNLFIKYSIDERTINVLNYNIENYDKYYNYYLNGNENEIINLSTYIANMHDMQTKSPEFYSNGYGLIFNNMRISVYKDQITVTNLNKDLCRFMCRKINNVWATHILFTTIK